MEKVETKVMKEESQEQPNEEKEEPKKEEKVGVVTKEDSSLIDKAFEKLEKKMDEKISELSEEIKKLKEKPQSKGVVTENENKPEFNLVIKEGKKGKDIYSEDILY